MQKKFAFVLMPFSSEFDDIYEFGIKGACKEIDVYCERVDEQIFSESILDRVYNQINTADIIIADLSDRNPNVFYEVGYAHALGKKVILLTKRAEDIPFDLKHYPHIIYNVIKDLKEQLKKRVHYFISTDSKARGGFLESIDIILNGTKLDDVESIKINKASGTIFDSVNDFTFDFAFKNNGFGVFDTEPSIQLSIPYNFLSTFKAFGHESDMINLPEGRVIYKLGEIPRIFPGSWVNLKKKVSVDDENMPTGRIEAELIISTIYGSYLYPFIMDFDCESE
ncbi:MAG: hypothetical protein CVU95_12765 [Firmicutes bacterium HGW-Firmicutes-2]|jgi:hypothetical protein|nr:MAG: hypothetical protein CVU95_12765 [Firmicutes bacterium HGW-Firmicutes-2]